MCAWLMWFYIDHLACSRARALLSSAPADWNIIPVPVYVCICVVYIRMKMDVRGARWLCMDGWMDDGQMTDWSRIRLSLHINVFEHARARLQLEQKYSRTHTHTDRYTHSALMHKLTYTPPKCAHTSVWFRWPVQPLPHPLTAQSVNTTNRRIAESHEVLPNGESRYFNICFFVEM